MMAVGRRWKRDGSAIGAVDMYGACAIIPERVAQNTEQNRTEQSTLSIIQPFFGFLAGVLVEVQAQ